MNSTKIANGRSKGPTPRLVSASVLILVGLMALTSLPAVAQSVQGDPTDLPFEIINGTTLEPGTVDRMTIEYVRTRRNGILDFEPQGSSFIAPGVPIKDVGNYIVTVWHQNVPYWWSFRGHQLLDQTTTLHVFDTTNELTDTVIKGLNLVVRRQESLLKLEYMLQVENTVSPQQTILDAVATFELDFPADASQIDATYRRGPDPTPFPAETRGSQRLSLVVPLTPGVSQIRLEASIPWQEGMEVPVGSNLEIQSWSILSAPEWLEVQAMGLESGGNAGVAGFNRWTAPPLAAKRQLSLQLYSGEHGAAEAEDLFTQDSPAAADAKKDADQDEEKGGGLPLPFVFGGVFTIILIAALVRKRQ